jgi:hypothetical protein
MVIPAQGVPEARDSEHDLHLVPYRTGEIPACAGMTEESQLRRAGLAPGLVACAAMRGAVGLIRPIVCNA